MKATPEDVAKVECLDDADHSGFASMKATPEDVAKPAPPPRSCRRHAPQ